MVKIPISEIFGWSSRAWHYVLNNTDIIKEIYGQEKLKILEIGASQNSAVSIYFDETNSDITIGYKSSKANFALNKKIEQLKSEYKLCSNYRVEETNIFSIQGRYDLIIMKSVLGGVVKAHEDQSTLDELLYQLCKNNLNSKGALITIDNGRSILEPFLKFSRARRNGWRPFRVGDISFATQQVGFGLLSSVSFSTRFGLCGSYVDTILFYFDFVLNKLYCRNPAIICTVIKRGDIV